MLDTIINVSILLLIIVKSDKCPQLFVVRVLKRKGSKGLTVCGAFFV
jgi:hypothetical protein